jgi:peptidoglycan/LPS O-acetylase OafA/YrhL
MGIELFRGIAALFVLMCHYAPFIWAEPNGFAFLWTGVDLFFVISGYVFAPLLLSRAIPLAYGEQERHGFDIRAFYIRRFFRIYPLYIVAVIAYAIALPAAPEKFGYFLRTITFLHTTRSFAEAYYFNAAFWSLPVEIEFYLVLPLLALLGRRLWWLGALTLIPALLSHYLRGTGADNWRILSAHLPAILPEFLAGTLLYQAVQRGRALSLHWHSRQALPVFAAGCVLMAYTYALRYGGMGLSDNRVLDMPFNLLAAAAYALMLYPFLLKKDYDYSPTLARIAKTCGGLSYGTYLFHNLMPRLLQNWGMEPRGWTFCLVAAALTFTVAGVLYLLYENPLRSFGRRLGARQEKLPLTVPS